MVCKEDTVFTILEAWVINRDGNALSALERKIIPLAKSVAGNRSTLPQVLDEFPRWVMTWLFERNESAHARGVRTDPLSYAYDKICEAINDDPALADNAPEQQEIFSRILMSALKNYAFSDYIRKLKSSGELPKGSKTGDNQDDDTGRTQRRLQPFFVPWEDWHVNSSDDENEFRYTDDGEPIAHFSEWEKTSSSTAAESSPDNRLEALKQFVAALPEGSRVAVRLRHFPAFQYLSIEDVQFVKEKQRLLPEDERLVNITLDEAAFKSELENKLTNACDSFSTAEVEWNFVGALLGCKPNTANTRVLRAFEAFRTACDERTGHDT